MSTPGLLKRWLSYLTEIEIGSYSSQYNANLIVYLHRGRYKLVTHGAIYSFSDLYSNFRKTFERLKWEEHPIKSCLILGLGLGSIPDMLTTKFNKEINYTAVEIDEQVIRLAMEYILRPKQIKVEVFTADAASFLEWHRGQYDLLCCDVFVGDRIPTDLQTEESLELMKSHLAPNGILLYNRLSRYQPDIQASLKFRDEVFLKVFPEGGYLDVHGNWMFVNRLSDFR